MALYRVIVIVSIILNYLQLFTTIYLLITYIIFIISFNIIPQYQIHF